MFVFSNHVRTVSFVKNNIKTANNPYFPRRFLAVNNIQSRGGDKYASTKALVAKILARKSTKKTKGV